MTPRSCGCTGARRQYELLRLYAEDRRRMVGRGLEVSKAVARTITVWELEQQPIDVETDLMQVAHIR